MGRNTMETVNRLIWGLFLIALGGMLLAVNLGWELPHGVWNYWPFLLIALGVAVAFRSGILNIGAEGQMLMGILASSATAIALPELPKPLLLPLALCGGRRGRGKQRRLAHSYCRGGSKDEGWC